MGFFSRIASIFSLRKQKPLAEMQPGERLKALAPQAREENVKECFEYATGLIFDDTGTAISKISRAKEKFEAMKQIQPLVWVDLVLAIYQQGRPVFDEVLGSELRDALAAAKARLEKAPDEKMSEHFAAIKKDVARLNLTNLKFLEDAPPAAPSVA